VIFGIAAIISIIVAIRVARRKRPVWAYVTNKIIGLGTNAPPELQLLFSGKPVPDVFRTILVFFNRGNETIRRDDVSRTIKVNFGEASILREPIIRAASREEIEFSAKQVLENTQNTVELGFVYLDHNDGAVIEVLHTACNQPICTGNIMGAGEPRYTGKFVFRPVKFAGRIIGGAFVILERTPETGHFRLGRLGRSGRVRV